MGFGQSLFVVRPCRSFFKVQNVQMGTVRGDKMMLSSQNSWIWYKALRTRKSPFCPIFSKWILRTNRVCPIPEKRRVLVCVVPLGDKADISGDRRCCSDRTKTRCPMISWLFLLFFGHPVRSSYDNKDFSVSAPTDRQYGFVRSFVFLGAREKMVLSDCPFSRWRVRQDGFVRFFFRVCGLGTSCFCPFVAGNIVDLVLIN
jgi:hypothetical protein